MDSAYDGSKDTDRRKTERRPSGVRIWADPGGVLPVIDCKILDISDEGAMVRASHGGALPDRFLLQHETFNVLGTAQVIWRNGNIVGVTIERQ